MPPALDPVETLCALDLGGRGIGRLVVAGAMAAAARSLACAQRVVLVTGFVARPTWAAETDGPSGTVVLGRAIRRIGASVVYLADPPVLPLLEACLRTLGEPRDLVAVPAEPVAALREARAAVATFDPTHLVAVERPGRALDGGYYNARGRSVAAINAPLDALFLRRRSGTVTIGVGDGGNEIGMGRVRARVVRDVPNGAKIASVVRTDHLIVAGTSNWGAWGLTAHLALATGRALLHTPKEEARLTRAMVRAGAVDGLTGAARPSVDNLPLGLHQALLETLRGLVGHLKTRRGPVAAAREEETA
jgi:D-glutamate cyclase-like protein